MHIGIDLGASKIESVVLDEKGKEHLREREKSPNNYNETLVSITKIVNIIEKKLNRKLSIGIGHPGSTNLQTGLLFNANNSPWMNKKSFQKDISKELNRTIYCENDANCFALSEATDGSASHANIVFGVILGSGCGGGLVIDKNIVSGSNNLAGEWGHNPLPYYGNLKDEKINLNDGLMVKNINIERFVSGKGIEDLYIKNFNERKTAKEIFSDERKNNEFINNFYNRLSRSLSIIINTLDPDAIVFGGGVSNEIKNLDLIKKMTGNWSGNQNIKTNFIKPKFGDASGVRGAALLGRNNSI
jgi:fructokinase